MKFFIPHSESNEQAESVYRGIKDFAFQQMGWKISNRRINFIKYTHDSKDYIAEVGKEEKRTGAEVIAILESEGPYLVCTKDRGVLRGEPIMIGKSSVYQEKDFE